MKAGQALVFNNKTLHASPPNVSEGVRLAVGFGVTQANAPMRHYYLKPGTDAKKLLEYEIDDYFFTNYNNGKLLQLYKEGKTPDDLKLLGELSSRVPEVAADELIEMIKAEGNTFNMELCEHLAKLFNYNMDGTPNEQPETSVEPEVMLEQVTEVVTVPEPEQQEQVQLEETVQIVEENVVDSRTFFQKYTPLNILREIQERVLG
jgi:hypothetical protein